MVVSLKYYSSSASSIQTFPAFLFVIIVGIVFIYVRGSLVTINFSSTP